MNTQTIRCLVAAVMLLASTTSLAGQVGGLTTFTAGTPAKAAEVNGNFSAVKTAVDDNDARIAALEAVVTTLQDELRIANSTIVTLQGQLTDVMALAPYLTVIPVAGGVKVTLEKANLQIINGTGQTASANGLGNLILGYDTPQGLAETCSVGIHPDKASCEGAGATWAVSHKTGSHYLVIGELNNYSHWGGMVVGYGNTSNGPWASVSGGISNTASGSYASVSGGAGNTASGPYASVSGGSSNTASAQSASVSGGLENTVSGDSASVSGGQLNIASGYTASVSGGSRNTASGSSASILGGSFRSATVALQTIPAITP